MAGSSIDGWLARKYDVQQTQANANAAEARARAGLFGQQADQVAADAAVQRRLTAAQGEAALGSAALSTANAGQVAPLASSEIGTRAAQAGLFGAQAGAENLNSQLLTLPANPTVVAYSQRAAEASLPQNPPGQSGPFGQAVTGAPQTRAAAGQPMVNSDGTVRDPLMQYAYSTGTARVPGQGDGTEDTVGAKLAPGEAVLNKAAAEHLGRTTIELLNAIGEQKMGLGMNGNEGTDTRDTRSTGNNGNTTANTPGYAKGTAKVPAKAPGKAPGKAAPQGQSGKAAKASGKPAGGPPAGKGDSGAHISPRLLAALMAGVGGQGAQPGVGMPPPGPAPMPMPMPQIAPQQ